MNYRKKLFEIIEVADSTNTASGIYDVFMMITIVASLVPLAFKTTNTFFHVLDKVTVVIFIFDYLFRLVTADLKIKRGAMSFVIYPFTLMAIIDLFAILPSLIIVNSSLRLLKVIRLLRTFRVFRIFKAIRYSNNILMILDVFKRSKESLSVVCGIAIIYTLVSALVIFNVEPDTFNTFFDAVYWATVSLTTMGYGDIYPMSTAGRIVTMISSFMGIAIVALPAGIITSGMMEEINRKKEIEKAANKEEENS